MKSPLTYNIIGAVMDVHSDMGPGYLEKSYQEAVEIALTERGITFVREAPIIIRFRNHELRTRYLADFVCERRALLELKAQVSVGPIEDAQVIHYLKGSNLPVGILANFGEESLRIKRYVGSAYDERAPI